MQDVKQAKEKMIKIRKELWKENLLMLLIFLVVIGKVNLADYLKTNGFYLLFNVLFSGFVYNSFKILWSSLLIFPPFEEMKKRIFLLLPDLLFIA